MEVQVTDVEHAERGNLGAEVKDGVLYVPKDVYKTIEALRLRSAEEVISAIESFPTSWSELLGWEFDEVQTAKNILCEQLRGQISDVFLSDSTPGQFAYGALPPDDLPPEALQPPSLPSDAPFGKAKKV